MVSSKLGNVLRSRPRHHLFMSGDLDVVNLDVASPTGDEKHMRQFSRV